MKKDAKLAELEREHCDYFQEITTLQKVLATAEDTRSPSTPSSPAEVSVSTRKRRRLADDMASSAAEVSRTTFSSMRSSSDRRLRFSHVNIDEGYIVIKN